MLEAAAEVVVEEVVAEMVIEVVVEEVVAVVVEEEVEAAEEVEVQSYMLPKRNVFLSTHFFPNLCMMKVHSRSKLACLCKTSCSFRTRYWPHTYYKSNRLKTAVVVVVEGLAVILKIGISSISKKLKCLIFGIGLHYKRYKRLIQFDLFSININIEIGYLWK